MIDRLVFLCLFCLFGSDWANGKDKFEFRILKEPLLLNVRATAYTHTEPDHLRYGKLSAYGSYLRTGEKYHSAAADWSFLPIGTVFRIKGYGPTHFVVDDYGSALTGRSTVDIYFETEEEMHRWGARRVQIEVLRIGDYRASYMILRERTQFRHCYEMAKRIYDRYDRSQKSTQKK